MIGENKNGKLIGCPKCKSINLEEVDHCFEVDGKRALVTHDVICNDCDHEFEIIDVYTYNRSEI